MTPREYMNEGRVIAFVLVIMSFLIFIGLIWIPIPETGKDHAKYLIGFISGSVVSTLINYYWGNSKEKMKGKENEQAES